MWGCVSVCRWVTSTWSLQSKPKTLWRMTPPTVKTPTPPDCPPLPPPLLRYRALTAPSGPLNKGRPAQSREKLPYIFCFLCCRKKTGCLVDVTAGGPCGGEEVTESWAHLMVLCWILEFGASSEHFRCYDEDPRCRCAEVRLRSSSFFCNYALILS